MDPGGKEGRPTEDAEDTEGTVLLPAASIPVYFGSAFSVYFDAYGIYLGPS